MKRRYVSKRPQAYADLEDISLYIAAANTEAALRFLDAAEAALHRLADMPEIGTPRRFVRPELDGLRSWVITGFERYVIFYRLLAEGIEVIRVLHSSRDLKEILSEER